MSMMSPEHTQKMKDEKCVKHPSHLDGVGLPDAQVLHVNDVAGVAVDAKGAVRRLRVLRPQLRQRPAQREHMR